MAIRYEVVDAEPLDIFMGKCRKCRRPKRETETGYPLSSWADRHLAPCDECGQQIPMERVYGIEVGMSCDDRCMGATGTHCECSCGGVNHGGIWSLHDEIFAGALAQYRATQEKRERTKMERRQNKELDRIEAFRAWCQAEPQKPLVDYLREYQQRELAGTERYPNPFLSSLVKWLSAKKPLTPNQLEAGMRTMKRRILSAEREAERQLRQPSEVTVTKVIGTSGMTLGVFTYKGDTYVCKPNRRGDRSYANKVVPCPPRVNKNGDTVKWELEYAPGVISKLTEDDRMPEKDVQAFLIQYGRCIVCGHGLKREKSVRGMMGKTCAEKLGMKWGGNASAA